MVDESSQGRRKIAPIYLFCATLIALSIVSVLWVTGTLSTIFRSPGIGGRAPDDWTCSQFLVADSKTQTQLAIHFAMEANLDVDQTLSGLLGICEGLRDVSPARLAAVARTVSQ